MFNHGIITAALFLLVGFLASRTVDDPRAGMRGLQGPAPVLAAFFTVAMLASIGLPGLNGFVSEFLVLLGFFGAHGWWGDHPDARRRRRGRSTCCGRTSRSSRASRPDATRDDPDLDLRERAVLAPLVGIMVLLGVYPRLVLDRIQPSVVHLLAHLHVRRPRWCRPMIAAPVRSTTWWSCPSSSCGRRRSRCSSRPRSSAGGSRARSAPPSWSSPARRCSPTASCSGSTSRPTARRRPSRTRSIEDGFAVVATASSRSRSALSILVCDGWLARERDRGRRAAHPRACLGDGRGAHGPGERPSR